MIMFNSQWKASSQHNNGHKKRLGELLIQKNLITQQQLETALQKQKEMGELLGEVLLGLGFISDKNNLWTVLAEQLGIEYLSLRGLTIPKEIIDKIPLRIARRYQIIPINYQNNILTVAMNQPMNILARDEIRMCVDSEIRPVLTSQEEILESIVKYYGVGTETIEKIMANTNRLESQNEISHNIDQTDSDATIVNFLNQIFFEAYKSRATDIHIEPFEHELIMRYRVDGILQTVNVPSDIKYLKEYINSRIKIMANLDISERRQPQDGHFRLKVNAVELDLRVSFVPTPHGESVVIRILNPAELYNFDNLDLADEERSLLEGLIKRPHGIIFITGPTGSGKTTTLYSCLSHINTVDKKIITIEDPVEYQLPHVIQIQVNPGIKLTFAKALRSILRQNPDVIMVGEVRDVETVDIAIQVALTGHLIFSTLHTNDAASGITRLLNMNVEPYLITSTIECFVAQRLVRVICSKCKEEKEVSGHFLQQFKIHPGDPGNVTIYKGKGCPECNFTGYHGRTAIYEFLVLDEEISDLILKRASANQIKEKAVANGMKTLRQAGWEKIKAGTTTIEEVMRVTQERSHRR